MDTAADKAFFDPSEQELSYSRSQQKTPNGMKTHALNRFLSLAAVLSAPFAQATSLTWDANGLTAAQTNGGGAWLGANLWWNGSTNQDWVSGSDAIFGGPSTAGGVVTLASPTTVGAITFNTFTGTYTLGTVLQTITLNGGLTNNSAAGAISLTNSPIILGGVQTWTNNSSGALTSTSGVNNGGSTLTLDGTGSFNFSATASIITGAGGLTKNGSGRLTLGGGGSVPAHDYAGPTILNGGVTMVSSNNLGPGNLVLNGGVIESYWVTNFTRGLGSANGQVQLSGGESGFSMNGANGMSVILGNNAATEAVWGSAFFTPSTLALQAPSSQAGASITFANKIDLNGANRTVAANGTALGVTATISGVIRNSSTTAAAGLTKTGPGLLILTGANTYNGGTTISQGNLRFGALNTMPTTGDVAVQDGATLTIEAGAAGDWTSATSGNGSLGGLLSGLGGQIGGTVSYAGNMTLGIETTASLTYAGTIGNVGTNLSIAKSGGSSLTLSGSNSYTGKTSVLGGTLSFNSIGNVGGGNSALGAPATIANGTLNVGFGGTVGTLSYTGTGHSTDRVINLSGTTGGATLDASGSGALTLTSVIAATGVGAKTLTLAGTNTTANTLASTAIPGLVDVLTISKSGAGTWWVNGFSSPKNAWSVTAGTLVVAGGITTGDQQVTITGGTLAGVGPVTLQSGKTLTVQAAGSLAPGNLAVGTLSLTGNLSISAMAGGTGKLNFQMAAPGASDKIAVTGTAQIGTGVLGFNDFVFSDVGGMTSSTYVLLSATGGITGTLDPANLSGTIGSITGTLQINGNNLEFTMDADGDGIPDSWMVQYFGHPTGLESDLSRAGDDADGDGLSNLLEYQRGSLPKNPDTDADGLADGVETNTGIWVSAANTGTNPLVLDSDGDTIRDGYETNTGIFVSVTNPGTNPNKRDSDSDGLRDDVETNTGTYVGLTDTGTNPNNADTDNDGAGDWYEVAIIDKKPALGSPPNSPNNPSLKPNIPYPLADPDASTGVTNKPVKVYIMSGQSNMVGFGEVNGSGPGTLQTITGTEKKFPNLVASGGGWTTRQDVKYRGVISDTGNGPLKPDVSGTQYGPELGFGYIMGWYHDEPVLLIKASQGNRGLMWDILPPGSPRTVYGATTYPAYGESPETWATAGGGPTPFVWYAGKQYDDFFLKESDMGPTAWAAAISYPASCQVRHNGVAYVSKSAHTSSLASEPGVGVNSATFWNVYSVFNTADVLDNFATEYPSWAAQGFEIAGFVWWQGYDDTGEPRATRYEPNLVQFIKQIRSYYENRYNNDSSALTKVKPNAPFVLATLAADGGWGNTAAGYAKVAQAQLNVDGAAGIYPEFVGNVKAMEARGFWRDSSISPSTQGYHYNWNAETYLLVGDALGRAMVDLESVTPPGNTFADWMTSYNVAPGLAGFEQDADGDGIKNGVENFFGTAPNASSGGLVSGASSGSTFTFTHPQNATPATGLTAVYRWSKDLVNFFNSGTGDGSGTMVSFNAVTSAGMTTVTATVTGTATAKLFVDVKVTQN